MAREARLLGTSGYMHIYSRGVNKQDIFYKARDYRFFLETLSDLSQEMGFDVIAYCLMPNHYHLVIYDADRRFSTIVKRLSISYSMHFNICYSRTGPLFQGRFGGKPIEDLRYLLTVVRYVHMNPQRAGICRMSDYKWSSYTEYLHSCVSGTADPGTVGSGTVNSRIVDSGQNAHGKVGICNVDTVLNLFGGVKEFEDFHTIEDFDSHRELEGSELSDEDAIKIVCDVIQEDNPAAISNYSKKLRDNAIREIRELGVRNKQLSRVTGLSIYVVQHVHK